MEPQETEFDRGVDFEGFDRFEQRNNISVVMMDGPNILDYFEKMYLWRFGEPLRYDRGRYVASAKRFKREFKDDAGRIVKWFFFKYDGMFYSKRDSCWKTVHPRLLAGRWSEWHSEMLQEVRDYRTRSFENLVNEIEEKPEPKKKSKFMGLGDLS